MIDYPDWVLKHKIKGTYLKHVKGRYYLYRGHSERVPGTKKVRFICDEYLGRISQEEGLIPPKDKVSGPVISFEFGLSAVILSSCGNIHKGFRKTFVKYGDFLMAVSVLEYLYSSWSTELLSFSWLSLHFPQMAVPETLTDAQTNAIIRGKLMIADTMERIFGDDLPALKDYLSLVRLLRINEKMYLSHIPDATSALLETYHIHLEVPKWLA